MIFGEEFEARERRAGLLREAGERRLARELRAARLARQACRPVIRTGDEGGAGITVRWGLHADDERVAELLELNGRGRWVAFEERFLVAEWDGAVLAALSYRTEPKRMLLGSLVVDPWAGEHSLALALYAGAPQLAREMGVRVVRAESPGPKGYPREAGYRRVPGGWRLDVTRSDPSAGERPVGRWRRRLYRLIARHIGGKRAFGG